MGCVPAGDLHELAGEHVCVAHGLARVPFSSPGAFFPRRASIVHVFYVLR